MKLTLKDRFAFWIERVPLIRRLVLEDDGRFYVNRINGHLVAYPKSKGDPA